MTATRPTITTLPCDWFAAAAPRDRLLVVLHGRGDTSRGFHWLPQELALAGLDYLLVNAPDPYFDGRSWYDLPPNQAPGMHRSRGLLDAVFDELEQQGRAPQHTCLLGFSQGCLMTLEWGLRSPRRLAGYVGISGYCLDPEALLAERDAGHDPERWLVTHGTLDDVLPCDRTTEQMATLASGGFPLRFETFAKDHTIDLHDELPLLREFVAERLGL